MKLSRKFLSDYIDIDDISTKEIAEAMVFAGNEYETITPLASASDVVVGYIENCKRHPDSDHLHICKVNYGEGIVQIVCGAPNVRAGIKVIIAKVGAILGNIQIKKATLAKQESNGMICALSELGIDSKYLKNTDDEGIYILDDNAPIGCNAIEYLGLNDEIIDFELTANRADLMSILGMAYEVGAIYNRKVHELGFSFHEDDDNVSDIMKIEVKTENCSMYLGKVAKNIKMAPSPSFIQNRLMASGIRPINNVVDISNYVMLEYGQPLHFFDKEHLGNDIEVRMALEGERLTTLDGKERLLSSEDIVIANQDQAICLAGVMGGLSTEIVDTTKDIFIEAAIFDPIKIRRTSNKILRSEASIRYEKGIDPSRTKKALERACYLLEKYAGATIMGGLLSYDTTAKESKEIKTDLDKIEKVLGFSMTKRDVIEVLDRLGFEHQENGKTFIVNVPTRRLDVNIECDLFEEIGRIYGYRHLEGKLPSVPIRKGGYSKKGQMIHTIRRRLMALGLYEVRSYSLISEQQSKMFSFRDYDTISILSPLTEDRKTLRTSLVPSHIDIFNYNDARSVKNVNIFEIASSYYKKDENYIEETMISALLSGNYIEDKWKKICLTVDFYTIKGMVCNLLDYMGFSGRYTFEANESIKNIHPYQSAYIVVDKEIVGFLGKIHPSLHKKNLYVFEMSLDILMKKKVRQLKYKEVSKFPSIHKDLAFVCQEDVSSESILDVLKKVGGRLLTDIEVFDVYSGENVKQNEKSIAYKLTFNDQSKTLQEEEVTLIFNQMIDEVENKCHVKLRSE